MRWILFDLVVGAALLWLVWDARSPEPAAGVLPAVAAVTPAPATPPVAETMPAELETETEAPGPAPADPAPAADRGQRLRALARDAEAMFLRGRE